MNRPEPEPPAVTVEPDRAADGGPAVRVAVKVVPGASRERVAGPHGGALKVMVAQPPEGGAANKAVCRLLAQYFDVAGRAVEVAQGHASPWKTIRVAGLTVQQARQRLAGG